MSKQGQQEPLPNIKSVKESVSETTQEGPHPQSASEERALEEQYSDLKAKQDRYRHKNIWSWLLLGCVVAVFAFQFTLIALIGCGIWDFKAYEWLLPALLLQNFGQIAGLAFIVVKSLFRD